jgi:hypothetical protein
LARINIESQFWTDVMEVAARMGDSDKAVGQALKLIKFAQEEHKKGKVISLADFRARFSDALMPEFAHVEGDRVVVRGAEKFFGWLDKKKAAGAKGGRSKSEAKVSKLKQNKAKPSSTEASYSSSISSSSSDSHSSSSRLTNPPAEAVAQVDLDLNRRTWEAYSLAYLNRYGTEPVRNAAVNSKIKQVGQRLGDEAPDVAAFYLSIGKSYYVNNLHPVGALLNDCEALRTQWATGKTMSNTLANQTDQSTALREQLKRFGGTK